MNIPVPAVNINPQFAFRELSDVAKLQKFILMEAIEMSLFQRISETISLYHTFSEACDECEGKSDYSILASYCQSYLVKLY
jgi:hypothetical protein